MPSGEVSGDDCRGDEDLDEADLLPWEGGWESRFVLTSAPVPEEEVSLIKSADVSVFTVSREPLPCALFVCSGS